ncbi:MAG TPA: hypothetical protein VKK79_06880 [Candidatus Lokiarchaeia archaeon]|nr:hypothetical protein [Candidatus Lokiarchaeia archaeon]
MDSFGNIGNCSNIIEMEIVHKMNKRNLILFLLFLAGIGAGIIFGFFNAQIFSAIS